MGLETPKNVIPRKLVKCWSTDGLTLRRSDYGMYSMTVNRDSLQPLCDKIYGRPGRFVDLTIRGK